MLKNFWYPIAFTDEVTAKPTRITVMAMELVVYRKPDGGVVCMSDLCVHRGGALSDGWTDGDCIVCPYHAWRYEPDGSCIAIPSDLEGIRVPRKARIDSYPAADKYGWVWAFLGDLSEDERPPIPDLPFMDDPDRRHIHGEYHWDAHYTRTVENSMDIAHAPWVHGGAFGNPDEPEVEHYKVDRGDYQAVATVTLKPQPAKGLWARLYGKEPQPTVTTTGFFMPCITLLKVDLPIGEMVLYNAHMPVDDYHTITKWIQVRNFFPARWADNDARKRVLKIFNQDKPFVEAQRPELLPYDLAAELHVRADTIQIAYRQMRNQFLDMGWGIDSHLIQSEYSRHQAVVIPSPARREIPELRKAWVMKEAPVRRTAAPPNGKSGNGSQE